MAPDTVLVESILSTYWGHGKSRKVKCSTLKAVQGAKAQQAKAWQGQVGREPLLFSPSHGTEQQVFSSPLLIFSPLYDVCRGKADNHAHLMKSCKVSSRYLPHLHEHKVDPWLLRTMSCSTACGKEQEETVRGSTCHWSQCTTGQKMYSPLEGGEDRGRDSTLSSISSHTPCGFFCTELISVTFDFEVLL